MSFKDNLRKERTKASLSQEALAAKMSVSRQTISKWENGNSYPSTEHVLMLTQILNCSMDKLIDNVLKNEQQNIASHNLFIRKYVYWITGAIAAFVITVLGFTFVNLTNIEPSASRIDDSKIAVFDRIIDGSLEDLVKADGYTHKKIVGYGITEENGTFYIKCDLNDGTGSPCSAIIYFCENGGNYSYECQYLDNPDYIPVGEYHKVG